MSRAFQHSEMKQVCRLFQQQPLPDSLASLLSDSVSPDLLTVTKAFIDLQEARHEADYNVGTRLTKEMAIASLSLAETAFDRWNYVQPDEANVFLAALVFGKRWDR